MNLPPNTRAAMEATYDWQFDVANRNQIEAQWLAAREHYRPQLEKLARIEEDIKAAQEFDPHNYE